MEPAVPSPTERFDRELAFVLSLANPECVAELVQRRLLQDRRFLNFLSYLEYWTRPPYSLYINTPQALTILRKLQSEDFQMDVAGAKPENLSATLSSYYMRSYEMERAFTVHRKLAASQQSFSELAERGRAALREAGREGE